MAVVVILPYSLGMSAAFLLIWTGFEHLRYPERAMARMTKRIPGTFAAPFAHSFFAIQITLGASVISALASAQPYAPTLLLVQALVYLAFCADLFLRLRASETSDCGCTLISSRVGMVTIARSGGLAIVSFYGALSYARDSVTFADLVVMLSTAMVLAGLMYIVAPAVDGLASPERAVA